MNTFEQEAKEKWGQIQAGKEYEQKNHSKQTQASSLAKTSASMVE